MSRDSAERGLQSQAPCVAYAYLTCEDDRFWIQATIVDTPELPLLSDGSLSVYSTTDNALVAINHGGDHGTGAGCSLSINGDPDTVPCMRAAFERLAPLVEDSTCYGYDSNAMFGGQCDACDCHINEVWPGIVDDDCDEVFQGDE